MSTTSEEIKIDLDELDDKKTSKTEKSAKSAPENDIKVEQDDETPKTPVVDGVSTDEALAKLKKQLADEQERRIAAEHRAHEASQGEAQARATVQATELDLVKNAITTLNQANDSLEAQYAEALAAQDFTTAAKAQREMSINAAKALRLEEAKVKLENAPKPTARAPQDAVEQFIAESNMAPQSADWVRAHPDYVRDKNKYRKLLAAHEIALADGNKVNTDEYFESVEKTLGIGARITNGSGEHREIKTEDDALSDAATPKTKRTPPASAPVTRSGTGSGNDRPNVVRLSPEEIEMASFMGQTPEEYARNKLALKKEGKLN